VLLPSKLHSNDQLSRKTVFFQILAIFPFCDQQLQMHEVIISEKVKIKRYLYDTRNICDLVAGRSSLRQ